MYPWQYSMVLHLVGVGMLCTTIFAGLLLHTQYKRTDEPGAKLLVLRSLRLIGLLSPAGVALMLLTGIGNMTLGPQHYTLFSHAWLSAKLLLFLLMVASGVFFAVQGARRARLVARITVEPAEARQEARRLRSLDTQLVVAFVVQGILLLAILTLSVARPQG